jgi:hydroxymethylpyrimidine/phosphomethylpyrimidine kinase
LARNRKGKESVAMAKEFVTVAIHHGLSIGKGYGPANPMAARPTSSRSAEHTSGENE